MLLDAALNPADIALLPQRDLSGTTCVVFDILRATSSMVTALAHGAAEIWPVTTIEEARALKVRLPDAILAGERHGDRIEGSPSVGIRAREAQAAASSLRRPMAPSPSAPANVRRACSLARS